MKKNRLMIITIIISLMCFALAGCGDNKSDSQGEKKLKIVTTVFPEYDWTRQILGERAKDKDVELSMLLDNGVDLHNYQPSAEDIAKISECDMFIYVGGESDKWAEDVLKKAKNKKMVVINLVKEMGKSVKEEEIKEGMQEEDGEHDEGEISDSEHSDDKTGGEHQHKHKAGEKEKSKTKTPKEEENEPEYDEHVWLSVKNAVFLSKKIEQGLEKVDGSNAKSYRNNLKNYTQALNNLDNEYAKLLRKAPVKTLLFGDRFPFRYLVNDYGIDYYAAFVGCSAESEASFKTIKFLAGKVDELDLKHIIKIEKSEDKIAKTIIKNTMSKNQDILTLDSMQSTTADDVKEGASYLDIMSKNLKVIAKALEVEGVR